MREISVAVAFLGAVAIAGPAAAGVMVIGNSAGRQCYEAARDGQSSATALEPCDRALAQGDLTSDERVATYVNRGIVLTNARRYGAAIEDFDRAMAMKPSEPESYLNKGSALLRSGASADEAKALFNKALEHKTRRPELAFFGRAITHEETGDVRSAYLDYRRALEAAPQWRLPRRELSRFQVRRSNSSM